MDAMVEIRELVGRLTSLSSEELANLRQLISSTFADLDTDEASVEDTAVLVELADIADQVMAEGADRDTKAQEAKDARDAARERVKAISGEADETEDEAAEAEEPESEEAEEPTAEEPAETEEAPAEPVTATGAVQRMARRAPKPTPSPEEREQPVTGVLTAAGGHLRGRQIEDRLDLGRELAEEAERQVRGNLLNQKVIVASAKLDYPPERKLDGDAERNTALIDAVCGPQAPRYDRSGALVATGGICAPVNIDYAVPTWAVADRPIKDGLPKFEASRGGVRYVEPPDIAEWEAATGIWSAATDLAPAGETKPVKVLACGAQVEVQVEAIPTRIGFGNMQSRFAPEQVAANTDVAFAAAARVAEENLLNLIEAVCVKKLETAQHLGIGRDLMGAIDYAVAAYRNIHRTSESQPFTAILPAWVRDLIRTDLAREQAHQNNGDWNVWEISDAQIDSLFALRHINVIWHLDGQKEPTSKNFESQYWGTPAEGKKLDELLPKLAGGAKKALVWYFFPEGAVQLLDGGRLDLGVVRDSVLDSTNDYEIFVEPFEGIANRAFAKGVWQILSSVEPTGGSASTVTAVAP